MCHPQAVFCHFVLREQLFSGFHSETVTINMASVNRQQWKDLNIKPYTKGKDKGHMFQFVV